MAGLPDIFKNLVPKKQPKAAISITSTFNPQNPNIVLSAPAYREHLSVLSDDRISKTSQDLLQDLFKNDPDVSATVGSYLTLADTPVTMLVYDVNSQIDPANTAVLAQLVRALTHPTDYTQGFTLSPNLAMLCQEYRYMLMLRGGIAAELVFDKNLVPVHLQNVDMKSIKWFQTTPGNFKPGQTQPGISLPVMLDIPSFFVAYHRRDPTKIYATSDFLSVINTVAARTQVINDIYRIMQVTGFPRMHLSVVEEVLMKNAPSNFKDDPDAMAGWANAQLQAVATAYGNLRSDQAFATFDSVEPEMLNDKNPGVGLDAAKVIDVLNAQNQAALKTFSTILGRGNGAVGVASAEVRIAAMNADQLNVPLKNLLDQALTFLINSYGIQGFVEVRFAPAELRPDLELEPQKVLRQSRLLQDLSLGNITDEEYHITSYGRLPPAGAPPLSGTGFMQSTPAGVDTSGVSSNAGGGSLNKSLAPQGSAPAQVKSKATPKAQAGMQIILNI